MPRPRKQRPLRVEIHPDGVRVHDDRCAITLVSAMEDVSIAWVPASLKARSRRGARRNGLARFLSFLTLLWQRWGDMPILVPVPSAVRDDYVDADAYPRLVVRDSSSDEAWSEADEGDKRAVRAAVIAP